MPFKLTFNKPATRQFLEGNEFKGLRIEIGETGVMFTPVKKLDANSVKISFRKRGGFEAIVAGSEEQNLLAALKNTVSPYFMLRREDKAILTSAYTKEGEPSKFEPHVRVWAEASTPVANKEKEVVELPTAYYDRVKWAYKILAATRGPGRPSLKVRKAQEIQAEFENTKIKKSDAAFDFKVFVDAYNSTSTKPMTKDTMIKIRDTLNEMIG